MVLSASQQANLLGNGRSSLKVKSALVTVAIVLCAVVTPCESQTGQLSCGKRQEDLVSTRITWGDECQLGEWPWHAAIFSSAYNKSNYICGGSIIHKNAVISSAHCFVLFNRLVKENLITVHVGLIDLNETTDSRQVFNVSKLIAHPRFLTRIGVEYDIAILKLSTDIVISWSVHPVCIWNMDDDHSQLVGQTGTIVGFGMDENDEMSSILQKAELTVVDVFACLDNDRETYGRVLTQNMYCAGGKTNVSACNGDSGGGMFFERDGTWYIRGIISFITMRPNAALCDPSKFTVFTDVRGFSDWVMESIIPGYKAPIASNVLSKSPTTKRPSNQTQCKGKINPKDGTCNVAHLFDNNFVLVAVKNKIMRVPLNGGQEFLVVTTYRTNGLDHDCAEGRFYWSNPQTKQILSAKYDGTDQKLFMDKDVIEPKSPENVAVDWISRHLYWADRRKKIIQVASLDNPNLRTVLIYENIDPFSIAVDPLRSKLYWANKITGMVIEWSNLDGTKRQELLSAIQVGHITSITVSTATGELCYVDELRRIECIDPFSKQIRTIANNLTYAQQLVLTDEITYWTDRKSKTIESINLSGVRQEPITMPDYDSNYSYGLTAVTDNCPLLYSPCAINNGDCPEDTFCLVNPSAPGGRSCFEKKKCKFQFSDKCSQVIFSN